MDVDGKNRKEKTPLFQLQSAFCNSTSQQRLSAGLRYNVDLGPEVQHYQVSKAGNYQHPQVFTFYFFEDWVFLVHYEEIVCVGFKLVQPHSSLMLLGFQQFCLFVFQDS